MDAERRVAGACMLSATGLAMAMMKLQPQDFLCRPYGWIFTASVDLAMGGHAVTPQTIIRKLGEMKHSSGRSYLDDTGTALVIEAIENVNPDETEFWADRVKKKAGERKLLELGNWIREQALSNPEDINAIHLKAEERLSAIQAGDSTGDEISDGYEGLDALTARIDRYIDDPDGITGLELGWPALDHVLDGLQMGNVTIMYAPSSRYKSFVAANMGRRLAMRGIPGLWYTTEMPKVQVQERLVSLESGLNLKWLRRDGTIGSHRDEIYSALKRVAAFPIYYSKRGELDLMTLRAEVTRQARYNGIQYVIIDLVDQVATNQYGDNETSNQSLVMRKMKALAKRANVHIILISHVVKGDKALGKKASLEVEDMKGSSSKYQDVDAAISIMPVRWSDIDLCYEGLDRKQIQEAVKQDGRLTLLLAVTKNRHGELAEIPFAISLTHGGRMKPLVAPAWVQQQFNEPIVCDESEVYEGAA